MADEEVFESRVCEKKEVVMRRLKGEARENQRGTFLVVKLLGMCNY